VSGWVLRGVSWASGGRAVVFPPERGGVGVLCAQADARGFAWLVVGEGAVLRLSSFPKFAVLLRHVVACATML
jgi:hypothetical protein